MVAHASGDRWVVALGQAKTSRDRLRTVFGPFRRLRLTPLYAALVLIMWTVALVVSPQLQTQIVHANSTNVANLLDGRIYTLFSSALVLADRPDVLGVLAMVVVLGIGELAWGWLRVAGAFLFGHIVATVVVFAGLATGIALNRLGADLATAPDVGISYGTVAVLGGLLVYLPLRRRLAWQVTATAALVAGLAVTHSFTAAGHLTALLLGFAAGYALRRGLARRLSRSLTGPTPPAAQLAPRPAMQSAALTR
jgi:hypothetical protein